MRDVHDDAVPFTVAGRAGLRTAACWRAYPGSVSGEGAPVAARAAAAAARTVAAGTARLFCAWSEDSPVPQAQDRRCEGVADLAARRARVLQAVVFTERVTAEFFRRHAGEEGLAELSQPQETIYDGANA